LLRSCLNPFSEAKHLWLQLKDDRRTRLIHIRGSCSALALAIVLLPLLLLAFPVPVYAASITLEPVSGPVDTSVLISGEGFVGRVATIHWDGQVMAEKVPITETGDLSCSLDIPRACKGDHVIEVTDDSHWTGSTASLIFTVLPHIKVFPRVGRAWSPPLVTGTGFAAFERDITITWDGNVASKSPIEADSLGKWSATPDIGDANNGEHFIGAFGNATDAAEVPEAVFIIGPAAKVKPLSGPVGTEITIDGFGFRTGEDGITITYDGKIIKCNIVGETDGSFSTTVRIPPSTPGYHIVGVYGSSFTPKGRVPDSHFEVIPQIELQPTSGNRGTRVTITGTGFGKNEVITISFDEVTLDAAAVADDSNAFSAVFEVPQSKTKEHIVTVQGSDGNSAQASFITEKVPPTTPELLSPGQGARLEIFGSVGEVVFGGVRYLETLVGHPGGDQPKAIKSPMTTFDWSEAADSDGVTYVFRVAADHFSSPALLKDGLANSEYALSEEDVLTPGSYNWRVQAIDDVGNESGWSEVWQFELIPMSGQVLFLSVAIPAVLVAAALAAVVLTWRANWPKR